ncbi:uncharacterized protein LOC124809915 [Hydra vulgaris]|uniref:uncharacterized protein LOC124809915 n=1 Tax=Hydra vulgaris TaxID=6087 RepID=UPI0032EA8A0C
MAYNLIDDALKRFKTDNLVDLNTFYETLLDTFIYNNNKMVSNEGLLNRFIDGTIRRNICAEVCIPSYLKDNKMHCVALRSEASGNCMYSSASLFFVADNTLMDVLRVLTSLEIYIHADYYYAQQIDAQPNTAEALNPAAATEDKYIMATYANARIIK